MRAIVAPARIGSGIADLHPMVEPEIEMIAELVPHAEADTGERVARAFVGQRRMHEAEPVVDEPQQLHLVRELAAPHSQPPPARVTNPVPPGESLTATTPHPP